MKRIILLLVIALGFTFNSNAQDFEWHSISQGSTLPNAVCNSSVDGNGNVYFISELRSSDYQINGKSYELKTWNNNKDYCIDMVVSKFSPRGEHLWSKAITYYKVNESLDRSDFTLYTDKENVYIAADIGSLSSNTPTKITLDAVAKKDSVIQYQNINKEGIALTCLNSEGLMRWTTIVDGESVHPYEGKKMAFTDDKILIMFRTSGNTKITHLNKDGVILEQTNPMPVNSSISLYDIETFNNSNSYILCASQNHNVSDSVSSLTKYNYKNEVVATFNFNWANKGFSYNTKLFIDKDNFIYAVGGVDISEEFMGYDYSDKSGMILKLDSNLNPLWTKPLFAMQYNGLFATIVNNIQFGDNRLFISTSRSLTPIKLLLNEDTIGYNSGSYLTVLSNNGDFINNYTLPSTYNNRNIVYNRYNNNTLYILGQGTGKLTFQGRTLNATNSIVISKIRLKSSLITGRLFIDANKNNEYDEGELGIPNKLVKFDNISYSTNNEGIYSVAVDKGEMTITPQELNHFTPNTNNFTVNISSYDSVITKDFAFSTEENINDLDIFLTSRTPRTRLGTTNSYSITVRNVGTTTLSPTIRMVYDDRMIFANATLQEQHTNNELIWKLDNLTPFSYKQIIVNFEVKTPPDADRNDTLCSFAEAIPVFGIEIDETDTTADDNRDTIYDIIIGAYDPNIKETNKPEIINVEEVNGSFAIDYTIHFQNTGNDTAFHVYLIDSLDADLKVESIEVLSASHDYEMSISENNTLRWDYYNILLVDSNTNEPMSHGFVKYRVWTKDNPGLGDEFTNFADIYFDFNEPVRTNTTSNRIDKLESVELIKGKTVVVYPNPSNGVFTVKADIKAGTNAKVEVMDLTGKLVSTNEVIADANGLEAQIDINTLPQGIYFVKVYANDEVYTAKVIKQ